MHNRRLQQYNIESLERDTLKKWMSQKDIIMINEKSDIEPSHYRQSNSNNKINDEFAILDRFGRDY